MYYFKINTVSENIERFINGTNCSPITYLFLEDNSICNLNLNLITYFNDS